jgi:hypothetical protein
MYSLRSYDLTQPADIAANQRGEISPRQRLSFDSVARAANRPALIMVLVIAILFALPVLQIWQSLETLGNKIGITIAVAAIVGVIIIVPFLRERARTIKFRQEILIGHIELAEGEVHWQWGRVIARTADRQLQSIYGPLTLAQGKYRFYVLPKSGGILSAQKVADQK